MFQDVSICWFIFAWFITRKFAKQPVCIEQALITVSFSAPPPQNMRRFLWSRVEGASNGR